MIKEEIIEMARRAGVRDNENIFEFSEFKYLERFAKLVAEAEREACAKLCEKQMEGKSWVGLTDEDLQSICDEWQVLYGQWMRVFVVDIEAKLKEKNTRGQE